MRNRNHQLYTVIQQHERNVANLSAELAEMRETNSKLQVGDVLIKVGNIRNFYFSVELNFFVLL